MKHRKWWMVGLMVLLFGCSGIQQVSNVTTSIKSTSNQTQQTAIISSIDGMLAYLSSLGFVYDDEMVIAGLEEGVLAGRRVRSNGVVYSIYQLSKDKGLTVLDEVSVSGAWAMDDLNESAIFVVGEFLFVIPDDDVVIRPYFE